MTHVVRAVTTAGKNRLRLGLPALIGSLAVLLTLAMPAAAAGGSYRVHKLVADRPGHAAMTDSNLVNGWGLIAGPCTPWWVADNGTDKSTLYDGTGNAVPLVVKVGGGPTGTVYNGTSDFVVSHDGHSGPSLFLFASEDGKIRGWNPPCHRPRRRRPRPSSSPVSPVRSTRAWPSPRWAATLPLRDRLPQRAVDVSTAHSPPALGRRVHGPEHSGRVRTVRHPGRQRHDLRDLRQAGCQC